MLHWECAFIEEQHGSICGLPVVILNLIEFPLAASGKIKKLPKLMEDCSFSQLNSISLALSWAPQRMTDLFAALFDHPLLWLSEMTSLWVFAGSASEAESGIAVTQGDHLLTSCCGLYFELFCSCAAVSFCASSTHVKHHWQPALFRRKASLLLTWTEPSIWTTNDAISSPAINCCSCSLFSLQGKKKVLLSDQ